MPDLSLNLRYLLWKKGVTRAEWGSKLATLLGWSEDVADRFFTGESDSLSEKALKTLARFGGVSEADLASKDLLTAANLDLFHENISFLIDLLPHGEKKRFAEKLGIDATTISRWKNGTQRPTKSKIIAIIGYFGLSENDNLSTEPIFLSPVPIGESEIRKWLHNRIEQIDEGTLGILFPALARLLK